MNDSELFSQGNDAYVDEDYQLALKKYSLAIELNGYHAEYYVKRATTYIKLGCYADAGTDANTALDIDPKSLKAHQRKGEASFHLGQYQPAKEAFEKGLTVDDENPEIKAWLSKCNAELGYVHEDPVQDRTAPTGAESSNTNSTKTSEVITDQVSQEEQPTEYIQKTDKALIRRDWYQTDTHVIIAIMIKNCSAEQVHISYHNQCVKGTVDAATGDYELDLTLAHAIDINQCKTRISQSKIELKLKKADAIHWTSLEKKLADAEVKIFSTTNPEQKKEKIDPVHQYPSSSHVVKDWDRLAADITKDEEDEKEEGEAALSALFQKIYGDGADSVKKAMNKSFIESGGTVLSTNWNEVGQSKVERKPPDGMEWRSWEH